MRQTLTYSQVSAPPKPWAYIKPGSWAFDTTRWVRRACSTPFTPLKDRIPKVNRPLTRVAEYHLTPEEQQQAEGVKSVAVAVRRKNLLATAFHPELTDDVRW